MFLKDSDFRILEESMASEEMLENTLEQVVAVYKIALPGLIGNNKFILSELCELLIPLSILS